MSGPRDPTPHEELEYRGAIEARDGEQLRQLVIHLYPNVLWGQITQSLSEDDRKWVMSNLREPVRDDNPMGECWPC